MFELGSSLHAARERQGLGYAEVELATKIRAKYIRALEAEDFEALPSDTYIRGFLRAYADFLGLDGEVYVDEYASRFITSWRDDLPPEPARRRRRGERTVERRAVVLALSGIAILTALVFAAWRFGGSTTNVPALDRQQRGGLTLVGVGRGTYLVVRRGSQSGPILFRGTLAHGAHDWFSGQQFYLVVRRPAGVGIMRAPGVTVTQSR